MTGLYPFFSGLYQKFADIPFQLDFGNFVVGMGTAFVALVSLQSIRRNADQRVAEFRKEWIENLRIHLAEIISLSASRQQLAQDREHMPAFYTTPPLFKSDEYLQKKWERFFYLTSYVQLMLNSSEKAHKELERTMFELMKSGPTGERLNQFVTQSRFVLKTEWDRVKNQEQKRK
jgi:hypothetical protein